MPRNSNQLVMSASDFQAIGDQLLRKIETILKNRTLKEPADETVPEAFQEHVERYFRALSDD